MFIVVIMVAPSTYIVVALAYLLGRAYRSLRVQHISNAEACAAIERYILEINLSLFVFAESSSIATSLSVLGRAQFEDNNGSVELKRSLIEEELSRSSHQGLGIRNEVHRALLYS